MEDIVIFVGVCSEGDDPGATALPLGFAARAWNVSQIACDVGMSWARLYKALQTSGNPSVDRCRRYQRRSEEN